MQFLWNSAFSGWTYVDDCGEIFVNVFCKPRTTRERYCFLVFFRQKNDRYFLKAFGPWGIPNSRWKAEQNLLPSWMGRQGLLEIVFKCQDLCQNVVDFWMYAENRSILPRCIEITLWFSTWSTLGGKNMTWYWSYSRRYSDPCAKPFTDMPWTTWNHLVGKWCKTIDSFLLKHLIFFRLCEGP